MPSYRKPKLSALDLPHELKSAVENWLIFGARLDEVERAMKDLTAIYLTAGRKRPFLDVTEEKVALVRPLYCFAVVTYTRCFGSGRRPPLKIDDIPQLTARNRQAHDDASRLRNKHFAHAVADEEGASVLFIPRQGNLEAGFAVYGVTLATPDIVGVKSFLALVRKVRRFVARKEHEAGNALARAILGSKATWAKSLKHGAIATK